MEINSYLNHETTIDQIKKRGYILVGTTGDYRPMSYYNEVIGEYEGFDVEACKLLVHPLGISIKFIKTTWETLTIDTIEKKFDIAMCGITKTFERQKILNLSDGYLKFGKTIMCRKNEELKYKTLEDINKKEVRVMINPGTNEKIVLENLKNSSLIIHKYNAGIL